MSMRIARLPAAERQQELAERLKRQDVSVLDDLLREIVPWVSALLKRTFHSVEVEDVVSVALTRAWYGRDSYDASKGSLAGWFYTIARRTAVDEIRRGTPPCPLLETVTDLQNLTVQESVAPGQPSRSQVLLREILVGLSEEDRRILLEPYHRDDDKAWAKNLADQWASRDGKMTPGNLRVRHHRLFRKVVDQLRLKLGPSGAPVPDCPGGPERPAATSAP
jgi:DNA-directed RNA polymerase specialized sigma24 family protein